LQFCAAASDARAESDHKTLLAIHKGLSASVASSQLSIR
jgi:hypothetical protein